MSNRTTVVKDKYWLLGIEKAKGIGLNMSQVVRSLVKGWVEGDVNVEIVVEQVDEVAVEVPGAGGECDS